MPPSTRLSEQRLAALYTADDFGGARTMRAKVIRELIDEIRLLRRDLAPMQRATGGPTNAPQDMNDQF